MHPHPHGPWHPPHFGRRSLFWKVYRHGLFMLIAVAVAMGVVSFALRTPTPWRGLPDRLGSWLSQRWQTCGGDPGRMEEELKALRVLYPVDVALYDPAGALVAANSAAPPPALSVEEARALMERGGHGDNGQRFGFAVALRGPEPPLYASVSSAQEAGGWLGRLTATLAAILLVMAAVSAPLVRNLLRPISQLTSVVQAFGEGDLGARSRTCRQDEVGALARAFDAMADRIEGLILSQKELLANVSHELRTPLARIRVALELADEGDAQAQALYLKEIAQDLSELERLIEDVLTTARLDLAAGRAGDPHPPMRLAPLDPATLLQAAADRFRAASPRHTLTLEVAGPLPTLSGDEVLLRRVVDNLLDNAGKYADISAPITLAARAEAGALVVEVRDRGPGINPDDLPHLFEPFYRADKSRTRGTGGVGLGLALAKRIIDAHGGALTAESTPGEGATFRFTLPA